LTRKWVVGLASCPLRAHAVIDDRAVKDGSRRFYGQRAFAGKKKIGDLFKTSGRSSPISF